MMNKKILAVAVAAGFTLNAQAAITLTDTTADVVTYATETYTSTDLNADGLLPVTNAANELDVITNLGFTIAAGTSKYVRVDLSGSEFASIPALTGANATATISTGGNGEAFVIFETTSTDGTNDLAPALVLTLANATYAISPTATSTVTVTLYDTASQAVNQTAGTALVSKSEAMTKTGSASTGTITVAGTATATVGSKFLKFTGDVTEAAVGAFDLDLLLTSGTLLTPAGATVAIGDITTASQDVNLGGDFSFGTFTLNTQADCAGADAALTVNTAKNVATAAALTVTTDRWLCVENGVKKETVNKGSYSITLVTDKVTNDIGKIVYNTTSVEVPYLTTFSAYNQRFYLINNGSVDSTYTFTFTSEAGVTATAKAAATGTIPAGEVLSLKASDVVTLTGKTRTSATIEVEAEDADFSAATQTVNVSTSGTDTTVLN